MTAAQRDSLNRLSARYVLPFDETVETDFRTTFPGMERYVLEIGFGMGTSTAIIAEENPRVGYLAVEVHTPGVGKLLWEIEQRGLENIRIIHADAVPVLRRLPWQSLDGVHIFFPDPWPKKRHRKRRLLCPEFIVLLAEKMRNGAYLYLTTDWEDYAEQMLSVIETSGLFKNLHEGFAPSIPWRPETAFERKAKAANRRVWELFFAKSAD